MICHKKITVNIYFIKFYWKILPIECFKPEPLFVKNRE